MRSTDSEPILDISALLPSRTDQNMPVCALFLVMTRRFLLIPPRLHAGLRQVLTESPRTARIVRNHQNPPLCHFLRKPPEAQIPSVIMVHSWSFLAILDGITPLSQVILGKPGRLQAPGAQESPLLPESSRMTRIAQNDQNRQECQECQECQVTLSLGRGSDRLRHGVQD